MNLAVLVSGTGTILNALIEEQLPIVVVVSDRPCKALKIAVENDIAAELLVRDSWGSIFDRDNYSRILTAILKKHKVDVVVMAGFGTILGKPIFDYYEGRVLNTHPSLLPKYKGWHSVKEALEAGEKETGTTVHIASLGVDEGPVLAQARVPIFEGDTEETLHERIKQVERKLYPKTIKEFLANLEGGQN
jgi:phosphoribosylglycinamide formyltransferase-1